MSGDMEDVVSPRDAEQPPAADKTPGPSDSSESLEVVSRRVSDALTTADYTALTAACLEAELMAASEGRQHPFFVEHMLALLYAFDPAPVHLFSQRMPAEHPLSASLLSAAEALQKRPSALFETLTSPSVSWPAHVENLVRAIVSRGRARALLRIALAYSTISVAEVAKSLGLSEEEARGICDLAGWKIQDGFVDVAIPSITSVIKGRNVAREAHRNVGKRLTPEQSLAALAEMTERLVRLQD